MFSLISASLIIFVLFGGVILSTVVTAVKITATIIRITTGFIYGNCELVSLDSIEEILESSFKMIVLPVKNAEAIMQT